MLREFEGASVVSLKGRRKELIYVNLAKIGLFAGWSRYD